MNTLEVIKAALPWIGTAISGPFGGVAASFLGDKLGLTSATIDTVKSVLQGMTPEKLAELKIHDDDFAFKMAQLGYDQLYRLEQLNTQQTDSVNKTMQAESASEHWPTYSWRPAIGFAVAWNLWVGSIIVLLAYTIRPELVPKVPEMLTALAGLNAVALPILGIASYFRGKAQADPNVQTAQITIKG